MTRSTETLILPLARTGTRRSLTVHRHGTAGARPKAYIQAGLHATEIPGLLVAHHLDRLLADADVVGEVVIVPVANPVGLDQVVTGTAIGRYALGGGGNFNRSFAALAEPARARLEGRIGPDAPANVAAVRAALAAAHAEITPGTEVQALRHALLGLALDADIVLDLHCDLEAVVHLYTSDAFWPGAADLAAELGAAAVLLARDSGGGSFDEACSLPWWELANRLGHAGPIPPACLSATVELRGQADVTDALAAADAAALLRFLMRRGVVAGAPGPLPAPAADATPLEGLERIVAPAPGVIAFHAAVGQRVRTGDPVADIVDPMDPMGRTTLRAGTDGLVMARARARFAGAGDLIASIAGTTPLATPGGGLLFD